MPITDTCIQRNRERIYPSFHSSYLLAYFLKKITSLLFFLIVIMIKAVRNVYFLNLKSHIINILFSGMIIILPHCPFLSLDHFSCVFFPLTSLSLEQLIRKKQEKPKKNHTMSMSTLSFEVDWIWILLSSQHT